MKHVLIALRCLLVTIMLLCASEVPAQVHFPTQPTTITLTGAVTGSGSVTIATVLANSGVTAGTYPKVTVSAQGIITSGAVLVASDIPTLTSAKISDFAAAVITDGTGTFAALVSPALTGVPTAPTATHGTNTCQVATTKFVLANGGSSFCAGNGICISGSTIAVKASTNITVGSGGVSLSATYPGQTSIVTLGTIATGVWHGTAICAGHLSGVITGPSCGLLACGTTLKAKVVAPITLSGCGIGFSPTYAGNTSLVTTGTITTGVWHGTAICAGHLSGVVTGPGPGLASCGTNLKAVGTACKISVSSCGITIASGYVGQTSITTLGTVTTGCWHSTATLTGTPTAPTAASCVNNTQIATTAFVHSVASSGATSGTSCRITVTCGVVNISAAYVGQSSITTLGTIGTGTWAATTVAVNHGGTGATTLTSHGVLLGNTTCAITATAAGGACLPLSGVCGGAPTFKKVTVKGGGTGVASFACINGVVLTGSTTTSALGSVGYGTCCACFPLLARASTTPAFNKLPVKGGGTGATTLTIHGVLTGQTQGAIHATGAGGACVPLTGVSGADPTFKTLTVIGGGTGATTLTSHGVVIAHGTSAFTAVCSASCSKPLVSNCCGNNPSFRTLPVAGGGTSATTLTIHGVLIGQTTSAIHATSAGTANNVLVSGGTSLDPSFGRVALCCGTNAVSGILGVCNGGTNLTSGTSGGVLGFTAAGTLASSALLAANAIVLGGGAGSTPTTLCSLGTTTTVLHGNVSGAPSFGAVSLTACVTNILPGANGGSGNGFFAVSGPSTSLKTFAFPNASATVLTTNAAVTTVQGGTGLTTMAAFATLVGNGTGNVALIAPGACGTLYASNGGCANPGFRTLASLGIAPLASPAFTGTPTVPTAAACTNTTQIASTAFALAASKHPVLCCSSGTLALARIAHGTACIPLSGVACAAPSYKVLKPVGGGTGVACITNHAILLGAGTGNITFLGPGGTACKVVGVKCCGGTKVFSVISAPAPCVTCATGLLKVTKGGTGNCAAATAHGVVIACTTSKYTYTAVGGACLPLSGVCGANPTFKALTIKGGGTGVVTVGCRLIPYGHGTSALQTCANLKYDSCCNGILQAPTGDFGGVIWGNCKTFLYVQRGSLQAAPMGIFRCIQCTTKNLTIFDSCARIYTCQHSGTGTPPNHLSGTMFTATATAGPCATTCSTSIVGTGVGTQTAPANLLTAGKNIRIESQGTYTTAVGSGNTVTFNVLMGSTVVATTGAISTNTIAAITNGYWKLTCDLTCRTTGSSGTVFAQGNVVFDYLTGSFYEAPLLNTSASTINTTSAQKVDVKVQYSVGTGYNAKGTNVIIQILN